MKFLVEAHSEAKEEQQETKPESSKGAPTSRILLIDLNTMSTSSIKKMSICSTLLLKEESTV